MPTLLSIASYLLHQPFHVAKQEFTSSIALSIMTKRAWQSHNEPSRKKSRQESVEPEVAVESPTPESSSDPDSVRLRSSMTALYEFVRCLLESPIGPAKNIIPDAIILLEICDPRASLFPTSQRLPFD